MEYLTFILTSVSSVIYVEGWILRKLELRHTMKKREIYHKCITVPAVFVCLVLCLVFRGNLKDSLFYSSCSYIASGQAADFKEQMESQERIEYYGTAEPPVRCGESHPSGLTEPLHFVY